MIWCFQFLNAIVSVSAALPASDPTIASLFRILYLLEFILEEGKEWK